MGVPNLFKVFQSLPSILVLSVKTFSIVALPKMMDMPVDTICIDYTT